MNAMLRVACFLCLIGPGLLGAEQPKADAFVEAWKSGKPLPAFSGSLEEAYALQRAWVPRTLDEQGVGGVKGGVVTPAGQARFGIEEPVGALLRASGRLQAGVKPRVSLKRFPGLKLETEIGFVLARDLEKLPENLAAFKQQVRSVVAVVELVAGRWETGGKLTAEQLAAVNVLAAGTIVGLEADPAAVDPGRLKLRFSKDDQPLHEAHGSDCWKGPWETAFWLAGFAHRQGISLKAGHLIICGALGKIHVAEPGRYRYDAGQLGLIEFEVE
ncbi:MAG: fumarylacetoacetate hydrolase family protein [Verrucomicrobiota bacterium]